MTFWHAQLNIVFSGNKYKIKWCRAKLIPGSTRILEFFDNHYAISRSAYLKVRKSQKHFSEFSILPKNERKMEKNYSESYQDIFFRSSLEDLGIPKIAFEIYWPLVTPHDIVTVFWRTKCVTKSRLHCISKKCLK